MTIIFKTSEACSVELIAHTMQSQLDETGDESLHILDMDLFPATAARVSFGNDLLDFDRAKDEKLINYLAEHKHTSTFEHQSATFMIECPLFIRSQIQRHRTFSYNEISRRYTSEELEFWIPTTFRGQAKSNKQASSDDVIVDLLPRACYDDPFGEKVYPADKIYRINMQAALYEYQHMIDSGISREQARAVLPQSLLTRFYMTGNLRNFAHLLELRLSEHSQQEVQVPMQKVADKLRELWPTSCRALGI